MGLKSGLYVMIFDNREDSYDDDFSDDSRWLGAVCVGEIPVQFRQSYLKALRKRFDRRYYEEYRSFGIDFHYHDVTDNEAQNELGLNEDGPDYPRKPTETELMDMILNSEIMSVDLQEALGFAIGVAKEMSRVIVELDKPIAVRDAGVAGAMLWASQISKHPDQKFKRWTMWKSGMGYAEIAKNENPRSTKEELAKAANTIAAQVKRIEEKLEKRTSTK